MTIREHRGPPRGPKAISWTDLRPHWDVGGELSILDPGDLPRRYTTYTSCFRREAGSAGKDPRSMQRLHEFHKVKLVRLCLSDAMKTATVVTAA